MYKQYFNQNEDTAMPISCDLYAKKMAKVFLKKPGL